MSDLYDTIIIGSGAGGGAAAFRLAEAGQSVLVLEKGDVLPRDGTTLDARIVLKEGRFTNHEPWQDGHGSVIRPAEFYNLGGKTKWYGAALVRFDETEFAADPARQYLPWPISLADLTPYYDLAETLLGVRRFDVEPDTRRIADTMVGVDSGWSVLPLPLGLAPEIADDPTESVRFDGFASPRGLKADTEVRFFDRLAGNPRVTVLTNKPVRSLVPDPDAPGMVGGVVCEDGTRYAGRTVLLAAGALSSPRVLQRFLAETGLDHTLPSAALVGRNFKKHLLTAVVGFTRHVMMDRLRKTVVMVHEKFPHSTVQPLGATTGEIIATEMPDFTPRFFSNLLGRHAYGFFLQTEDGSHPDNRVVAALNGVDRPRLDFDPDRIAPARDEHAGFVATFRRDLRRAGFLPAVKPVPITGTAHACGTLVTGSDPVTSVVDPNGRVHGLRNVYVVDGSVLPRSSRVNPALTIYAWALRVADHLTSQNGVLP